jgi:serine/threonine protein kinase
MPMASNPVIHPSAELLQSFHMGKLDQASAAKVASHLEACPSCRQQLVTLAGDCTNGRLGDACQQSEAIPPTRMPQTLNSSPAGRSAGSLLPGVPDLPADLANTLQYHVVRELGRGGMGVVYLAKNVLLDRLEVLKVVSKTLLHAPGARERFLREIRSAAKLSHHNVVKAHSALLLGDLLVFAMEHVEGEDLAKVVKQNGPLSVQRGCFYLHQAALGLQHAHEHGMVHRDIKPHNLILSQQETRDIVKILDFGLAKASREGQTDTGLTAAGIVLGTPDYMAPEQALDAAKADIRADIYSLGCTLYALMTGAPPFQGKSIVEVLQAHVLQEARPLNQWRGDVPVELAAVVAKMMAKDPAQRFQKPIEVAQALAPFCKPLARPGAVPPIPAPPPQVAALHKSLKAPGDTGGNRQHVSLVPVAVGSLLASLDKTVSPDSAAVSSSRDSRSRCRRIGMALLAGVAGPIVILLGVLLVIPFPRHVADGKVGAEATCEGTAARRTERPLQGAEAKSSGDHFRIGSVWEGRLHWAESGIPVPFSCPASLIVLDLEGTSFKARIDYETLHVLVQRVCRGTIENDVINWSGKDEELLRGHLFPGVDYVGRVVGTAIKIQIKGVSPNGRQGEGLFTFQLKKS